MYARVGAAILPYHRNAVDCLVVEIRVQREIACVHWVGRVGPVVGSREHLHFGELGGIACHHTPRQEELGLDGRGRADSVFPASRQSLHCGKDVPQRQACDYDLEELRRVKDDFARSVWSVAEVMFMFKVGDLASGLALLLEISILRTFKRLRLMTDFGRALVVSVRRVYPRRASHIVERL